MERKRILSVQDISCVGQCSLTVALPVLSACGHETCVLPTEVLSTHTAFPGPAVRHLEKKSLLAFVDHWQRVGITFDAVCTGYLGSVDAVDVVLELSERLLAPEGLLIVDPAMADHGRLYTGLDASYAERIKTLSSHADVLLPNLTEAALLAGSPWREHPEEQELRELICSFPNPHVILTGVSRKPGQTGVAYRSGGKTEFYSHIQVEGSYSGTGDLFAACFAGLLLRGRSVREAVKIAAEFTAMTAQLTHDSSNHPYGIRFEAALPWLIQKLQEEKPEELSRQQTFMGDDRS